MIPQNFTCTALCFKWRDRKLCKAAFERLLNSVHETHIVFENLSNIDGDMLQESWGLNFGEGGIVVVVIHDGFSM